MRYFLLLFCVSFIGVLSGFSQFEDGEDLLDEEFRSIIEKNDKEAYLKLIRRFETTSSRLDDMSEEDLEFLFRFAIMPNAVVQADQPELSQLMIDSMDTEVAIFFELSEESFVLRAAAMAAPRTLTHFFNRGIPATEKLLEELILCDYLLGDEVYYPKEPKAYLEALQVMINHGLVLSNENVWLDVYFERSDCGDGQIPILLESIGAKGNEENTERVRRLKTNEYMLTEAIKANDYNHFKELLALVEDRNFEFNNLHVTEYAIRFGREQMLKDLLEKGWTVESTNPYTEAPRFHQLSITHPLSLFRLVLSSVSDINFKGENKETLLYKLASEYASLNNSDEFEVTDTLRQHAFEVFSYLLSIGADASLRKIGGWSGLPIDHIARFDINNTLNKDVFTLFMHKTSNLHLASQDVMRAVFTCKDSVVVEEFVDRLDNLESVIDFGTKRRSANGTDYHGLKYAIHSAGRKISPHELKKLVYHYSLTTDNALELNYVLDSIPYQSQYINSTNRDSIMNMVLNYPYTYNHYDSATILFQLLDHAFPERGNHDPSSYEDRLIAFIKHGATLSIGYWRRFGENTSSGEVIAKHLDEFKYLPRALHTALIQGIDQFDFNTLNRGLTDPATGKLYQRSDIYRFEHKRQSDINQKFCANGKMTGPSNTSISNSGISKVWNLHCVNAECDKQEISAPTNDRGVKKVCNNESIGQMALLKNGWFGRVRNVEVRRTIENDHIELNLSGDCDIKDFAMQCDFTYLIPACQMNDSIVNGLPVVRIINDEYSNGQIRVVHNGEEFGLPIGKEVELNRSLGDITLSYSGSGKDVRITLEIDYNVSNVDIQEIQNRSGSSFKDRILHYIPLYELHSKPTYNPTDIALMRLLSEYTLEKGFDRAVREELKEAHSEVIELKKELLELYQFHKQLATQHAGTQTELIRILRRVRDDSDDSEYREQIDRTINSLIDGDRQVSEQLEVFTNAYFQGVQLQVERFERALLEYSLYETDEAIINQFKTHPNIQIIL